MHVVLAFLHQLFGRRTTRLARTMAPYQLGPVTALALHRNKGTALVAPSARMPRERSRHLRAVDHLRLVPITVDDVSGEEIRRRATVRPSPTVPTDAA